MSGSAGRVTLPRYFIKRSDNYHLHAETVILAWNLQCSRITHPGDWLRRSQPSSPVKRSVPTDRTWVHGRFCLVQCRLLHGVPCLVYRRTRDRRAEVVLRGTEVVRRCIGSVLCEEA